MSKSTFPLYVDGKLIARLTPARAKRIRDGINWWLDDRTFDVDGYLSEEESERLSRVEASIRTDLDKGTEGVGALIAEVGSIRGLAALLTERSLIDGLATLDHASLMAGAKELLAASRARRGEPTA